MKEEQRKDRKAGSDGHAATSGVQETSRHGEISRFLGIGSRSTDNVEDEALFFFPQHNKDKNNTTQPQSQKRMNLSQTTIKDGHKGTRADIS
jgi:hypothetical protein